MDAKKLTARASAVFLDDTGVRRRETMSWVRLLNEVGLSTAAISRRRWKAGHYWRVQRAAIALGRPVVIGRGDGAETACRLLRDDAVRAAVLIAADCLDLSAGRGHPPVLILDVHAAQLLQADALRRAGICDRQLVDGSRDALLQGENAIGLAYYIRDWLEFHRLTVPIRQKWKN